MCTVILPPGVNPIAVKKKIKKKINKDIVTISASSFARVGEN
jgi:hypothetical protein